MLSPDELRKIPGEFPEDIKRMRQRLEHAGHSVSDREVVLAWAHYSDSLCANWMALPRDDDALTDTLLAHMPDAPAPLHQFLPVTLMAGGDATGDLVLALPAAMVDRLGWKAGDVLMVDEYRLARLHLRRA